MSSLSGNVQQVLRQSEEDWNSMTYDQILIRSLDSLIIMPTSLAKMDEKCMAKQRTGYDGNSMKCDQELIRSVEPLRNISIKFVLKHHRKYMVYQGPWNDRNSMKCDQKSMRSEDPTNKNFYQVWGQYHD